MGVIQDGVTWDGVTQGVMIYIVGPGSWGCRGCKSSSKQSVCAVFDWVIRQCVCIVSRAFPSICKVKGQEVTQSLLLAETGSSFCGRWLWRWVRRWRMWSSADHVHLNRIKIR